MLTCDTPIRGLTLPAILLQCVVLVLSVLGFVSTVEAQSSFGSVKIGASATHAETVTAVTPGAVSRVEVLTSGAPGLDFSDAGDTCAGAVLSAGQTCSIQVKFAPKSAGLRLGAVVLLDDSGAVLGTAYLQGIGMGGLGVFSPPNEATVAGSGGWTTVGDGNPAVDAQLNLPASIALDGAGNLYIADSQHNRIRMLSSGNGATIHNSVAYPQAGYITTIAGGDSASWSGDGSLASDPSVLLNQPSGLSIDGAGNIFIADNGNNVIRKIDAATGIINTVAGNGNAGPSGTSIPALKASLASPWGVTVDASGNLFIADTNNHQVRALCGAGVTQLFGVACGAPGTIITIAGTGYSAGTGIGGFGGDGGPAIEARLYAPYAVAFDAAGNMYIPDSGNNRVRRVDPSGTISTFAGTGKPGSYGDGYLATAAQLQGPVGIAIDPAQNVYISDGGNSSIRKVLASTKRIYTVARGGVGERFDGQKIQQVALYGPKGIALDSYGNLYIADYFNMRVRVLQSNAAMLDYTLTPVLQGDTSAPQNQVIENDGNDDLTISSINPDTNSAYDVSQTTCSSASPLAMEAQCIVAAEFAPSTADNPVFGAIAIDADSQNAPLVLTVAGDAMPVNATTVAIISGQNPSVFGQPVSITATVTTGHGTGQPTGTLAFYDGSNLLQGGITINSLGTGTLALPSLTVGSHTLTAKYSGDQNHLPSTSFVLNQMVTEPTAVVLQASANPAALGSSVTLKATISAPVAGGVRPTGLVAFLDGATTLGTVQLGSSGLATLTTSQLAQGAHTLTAQYGGNTANYVSGSTSDPLAVNVVAPSMTALSASPNPADYGSAVNVRVKLKSNSAIGPTGTVTLFDGNQAIGSQSLSGTTEAFDWSISDLTVGTHAISASYSGDQNVAASTSATVTQVVRTAKTTTVLASDPAQPLAGMPIKLIATVSPSAGAAAVTGTITFTDGNTRLGTAELQSGSASLTTTLSSGPHTLSASYGGDANDAASKSAVLKLAVKNASPQVALTSSALSVQVLAGLSFTATVSSDGVHPTGTVQFTIDGAAAGSAALDRNGSAIFEIASLPVGTHFVSANYPGDANNAPAQSATLHQVISPIPTNTLLTTSSTGGNSPQTILVASVQSSSGHVPTGTVTFLNGSSTVGTVPLDEAGVATYVPSLPAGSLTLVAEYAGDANHSPSISSPVNISVQGGDFSVRVAPPSLDLKAGDHGTLTITLASNEAIDDTIHMGCVGLPDSMSCRFSADTVPLKKGEKKDVQVIIATSQLFADASRPPAGGSRPSIRLSALPFPGVLCGFLLWRSRRRTWRMLGLCAILFISAAAGLSGCGASVKFSDAPAGTYQIQVGGKGAATNAAIFENVTVTVK